MNIVAEAGITSSGASGWLRVIRGLFGSRDSNREVKKRLIAAKIRLEETLEKVEEAINRLKSRDAELFANAVKALTRNDDVKASIYAGEIAEIRRIIKTLTTVKYAIEKVKIRLETIQELEDVGLNLIPLITVVKNIKDWAAQLIPEVSMHLDEALNSMQELVTVSSNLPERTMINIPQSADAVKILEEAQREADREFYKTYARPPELPSTNVEVRKYVEKIEKEVQEKLMEKPRITTQAVIFTRKLSMEEIKERVLDYIKSTQGFLDLVDCARKIGVEPLQVRRALEELIREGRIRLVK